MPTDRGKDEKARTRVQMGLPATLPGRENPPIRGHSDDDIDLIAGGPQITVELLQRLSRQHRPGLPLRTANAECSMEQPIVPGRIPTPQFATSTTRMEEVLGLARPLSPP